MRRLLILIGFSILLLFIFINGNDAYKIADKINVLQNGKHYGTLQIFSLSYAKIRNHFNFMKPFLSLKPGNENTLSIELTDADLKSFNNAYIYDSSEIFLRDELKEWRNTTVSIGNSSLKKAKIKLSGTGKGTKYVSRDILTRIFEKLYKKNIYNPVLGGYSFKIKLNKNDYLNNQRTLRVLNGFDDWSPVQKSLNVLAAKFGIVTSFGKFTTLFINGVDAGMYMVQEDIGKDLLERNYGITNYAMFQASDEWDSITKAVHTSRSDYFSGDYSQKGVSEEAIGNGQQKLSELFDAINNSNYNKLIELVDVDYFARLFAFQTLYGTNHSSIGDNRVYIYDFSRGKFIVTFRMEGHPTAIIPNENDPFKSTREHYDQEDKLFTLLRTNEKFNLLMHSYLHELIKPNMSVLENAIKSVNDFENFQNNTKHITNHIQFRNWKGISALRFNLKYIKTYFNYGKVFITEIRDNSGLCKYRFATDSYTPIVLKEIKSSLKLNQFIPINIPYFDKKINEIDFKECIKEFKFQNQITLNEIPASSIGKNFEINEESLSNNFTELHFKNYFEDGAQIIKIMKGNYFILEDILFPKNSKLIIDPGVTIQISANKSLIINGSLKAVGTSNDPIIIKSSSVENFGVFAVNGPQKDNEDNIVHLKYFNISGGNEAIVNNIYFSGQMTIINSNVLIENSSFSNSSSDDGLNIKYSNVKIKNSSFFNNKADQVDLDYSDGEVTGNSFFNTYEILEKNIGGDGLDVSGSEIMIYLNEFKNIPDKAISVGEKSNVKILKNSINFSKTAIAVKDESYACILNNKLNNNTQDIISYVKKPMYKEPEVDIVSQNNLNNDIIGDARESCKN